MSEWEPRNCAAMMRGVCAALALLLSCSLASGQEKLLDIGLPGGGGIVILPEEGEGDGGLIDIDLPPLPLPILGADSFVPDNTPALAIWTGLQNLLDVLNLTKDTHNFHVQGDEDWSKFEARRGSEVTVTWGEPEKLVAP